MIGEERRGGVTAGAISPDGGNSNTAGPSEDSWWSGLLIFAGGAAVLAAPGVALAAAAGGASTAAAVGAAASAVSGGAKAATAGLGADLKGRAEADARAKQEAADAARRAGMVNTGVQQAQRDIQASAAAQPGQVGGILGAGGSNPLAWLVEVIGRALAVVFGPAVPGNTYEAVPPLGAGPPSAFFQESATPYSKAGVVDVGGDLRARYAGTDSLGGDISIYVRPQARESFLA